MEELQQHYESAADSAVLILNPDIFSFDFIAPLFVVSYLIKICTTIARTAIRIYIVEARPVECLLRFE